MHQIRFPLVLHLRPRWGAHSAPRDPLAVFRGAYSVLLREGGEGKERRKGRGRKGRDGTGERPYAPPVANSWLRH